MFLFPVNYEQGWTLQNEIKKDGIGLHTGLKSRVIIKPTELEGFYISFSEEPKKVIPIDISQVRNTPLCTTIDVNGNQVSTVEHLLASLIGAGSIPIYLLILTQFNQVIFFTIMFVLIFFTHRENIKRLKNKEETKTKIY